MTVADIQDFLNETHIIGYANTCNGNFQNFIGEEQILYKDELIYQARYFGGLVDQKAENQ